MRLDRLPVFTIEPELTDQSGGLELAHSVAYLETRVRGGSRRDRPSTMPFSDGVVPTSLDPSLAPEGKHVISLFTQWVPHGWSEEPHHDELEATPTASSPATTSWRRGSPTASCIAR